MTDTHHTYHKITRADCLSVATADEKARLEQNLDLRLWRGTRKRSERRLEH